jgi:DNA-binding transcriptional regulator YiaG
VVLNFFADSGSKAKGDLKMTAQELKRLRERAGFSMTDLAQRLGTSVAAISMAEAGKRRLSEPLSRLVRIVCDNATRNF